ncbi:MAG: carboxylesterase family protein, partial [Mariniblastus sp.]
GAFHGLEIGYVFENLDRLNSRYFNDSDHKLSETMSAYWREFARTGTPDAKGLPAWPTYDGTKAEYLELSESITVKQRYRQKNYELLEGLTQQSIAKQE